MDLEKQDSGMLSGNINNPLVSIWMVTYNHEDYITQAIESVMMQVTNFRYKLFIGEDCSIDKTREICEKLKEKYPDKIELYLNEKNLGGNLNAKQIYKKCFESNAKYIALLEGDDYWTDPFKLQKQVDFLEVNPDYSMCFTRFKTLQQNTSIINHDLNSKYFDNDVLCIDFNFEIFAKGWHVGTQTLLYRKDMFDVSLVYKYKYFKDIHLFTELLKNGKGKCLNFFSAVYRLHDGGIYSSINELQVYKIGSLSYEELYLNNKNIEALKIKYYSFTKVYIGLLIQSSFFDSAFRNIVKFSVIKRDFSYFKENLFKISKIILKKIKRKIL